MTRHSKNCTANAVYSYHEKSKDAKASGYGSLKQRMSKDAVKDFDCCSLSLHPCRNPVITQDGYIYDKESILEYIISKKNEISRKMKEYEKQCKREKAELEELGAAEHRSKVEKFLKAEDSLASGGSKPLPGKAGPSGTQKEEEASVSNMVNGQDKKLPSFWIPALTPGNTISKLGRPDKTIHCPMSGKPLRVKDLIPVKFTIAEDPDDKSSLVTRRERYKCPVTGDILGNNIACAVLKPTGDVVTMECVETLIKKDMLHPLTDTKLADKDIIPIQRGGTGFSQVNDKLYSVKARPVLQA